jgi:hypothetical protein
VLVVAAAGNAGRSDPVYPAAYDGVLAVGSTDADGTRTSAFSNRGSWVDLMAPGESIVSTATTTGGYASFDGTSFASPLVAGAAALVLATHPAFTAEDVTARLVRTATRLSGTGGVLDAGAAVVDAPGGYVLLAADGGAFTFGDATFAGSTGAIRLNQPIVGMAATPSGHGYWLVARDGGIFAFGDAQFAGSTGGVRLSTPIVGMAAASRSSYWLVAADGSLFTFGGAAFYGSAVNAAGYGIVGIAAAPDAKGYWLARSDGVALPFGRAVDAGRTPPLNAPIVAIGST